MQSEKTTDEIRDHLNILIERRQQLVRFVNEAEQTIKSVREEIESLEQSQGWHGIVGGVIPRLRIRLAKAERLEADEHALTIVFDKEIRKRYVLVKVTNKRIFIREAGDPNNDQYELNGNRVGNWYDPLRIDIRKTFGIDADKVPPNWKPSVNNGV